MQSEPSSQKVLLSSMSNLPSPNPPEDVLAELRKTCADLRGHIKRMYPPALIGYLWAQVLMSLINRHDPDHDGDGLPSVSPQENAILFGMEYIHATIAVDGVPEEPEQFDEAAAQEIIRLSDQALKLCFQYQMVATARELSGPWDPRANPRTQRNRMTH